VLDILMSTSEANKPDAHWKSLLEAAVPRAYYMFTSLPGLGTP
jgi:hypothetical protein